MYPTSPHVSGTLHVLFLDILFQREGWEKKKQSASAWLILPSRYLQDLLKQNTFRCLDMGNICLPSVH